MLVMEADMNEQRYISTRDGRAVYIMETLPERCCHTSPAVRFAYRQDAPVNEWITFTAQAFRRIYKPEAINA